MIAPLSSAATPSLALGIQPVPRLPPLQFDDATVPEHWFGGDPARTACWSAFSLLAETAEAQFMSTGRWLVDRVEHPDAAEELTRFMRQEASHSAVHRRLNGLLADRGLPIAAARASCDRLVDWLREESGEHGIAAMSIAGEQAIGEMGHATLDHPEHFEDAAGPVRDLFLWHWYEEVEHQAALYDGWQAVVATLDARIQRRQRWFGILAAGVFMIIMWPVLAVLFARAGGARLGLRGWGSVGRQLFGASGLLRRSLYNVLALLKDDFHPFDLRDPRPSLARWDGVAVKPGWARRFRPPRTHGGHTTEVPSGCTLWTILRLAGVVVSEAWGLWRTV